MDGGANDGSGKRETQKPEPTADAANGGQPATGGDQPTGDGAAAGPGLPVVWSPRLDGAADGGDFGHEAADAEVADAATGAAGDGMRTGGALRQSWRFILLAAALVSATAAGSFVGSLSATGLATVWPANKSSARADANASDTASNANAQVARLAERLDRLERAQIDPSLKLARLTEAVDRLEKRMQVAAAPPPETTGSVAAGTAPSSEATPPEHILRDWIVRGANGGRALIENRRGALFDVAVGSVIPGLGRIEAIKRHDGQWVVVSARGVITDR